MPLTPISPTTQGTHVDQPARQRAHASATQHLPGAIETRHVDAAAAEQAAQPAVRVQSHKATTHAATAGHIFALRDGSGYVIQGSDGHYYRLDASASSALAASPPGFGYVDSALVNVNAGTVSIGAGGSVPQLKLPGSSSEPPSMPLPLIKDAGDARQAVDTAHTLIHQSPATALSSQANLDPMSVLLLLR